MTITHVLNRGARLLSVAYVRVGFECCARSGWHWWVGLHELRWATAASGSNGRRLVPGAGVRGRSTAAGPGGGAAPGGEASVAPPPPILCCPSPGRREDCSPFSPGARRRLPRRRKRE